MMRRLLAWLREPVVFLHVKPIDNPALGQMQKTRQRLEIVDERVRCLRESLENEHDPVGGYADD